MAPATQTSSADMATRGAIWEGWPVVALARAEATATAISGRFGN
jgi:hypothetical protein